MSTGCGALPGRYQEEPIRGYNPAEPGPRINCPQLILIAVPRLRQSLVREWELPLRRGFAADLVDHDLLRVGHVFAHIPGVAGGE